MICTNGGIVYDYLEDKVIYKETIPKVIVEILYNISTKYDARLIFGGIKTTYTNKLKYPDKETLIPRITNNIYDKTFNDNGNVWIDISPVGVSKGKAIKKLLEYFKY